MFRYLESALILAGVAQLSIASSSVLIPRILGWREETRLLRPLTRQVFWTYSTYILSINTAFGLLALLAPASLIDGSTLARAVCGYTALYWTVRLILQFTTYDRSVATRPLLRFGEAAFVCSFLYLSIVYTAATVLS